MSEQQMDTQPARVISDDLEAELREQLEGADMAQLLEETPQNFKEGEVVRGKVVNITDDRIMVDIGYKK